MIAKLSLALLLVAAASAVEFDLTNNSPTTPVYVQILGTVAPEPFTMQPNEKLTLNIVEPWSGRVWGRIDCYSPEECGQAGPIPASLAEITVGDGFAFYDISLVDGFNIQISFGPIGGNPSGDPYSCTKAACEYKILEECPEELKLFSSQGVLVSCVAACNVFNTDLYCCRGEHDTPETCNSADWPVDYAGWFKERCPDAYSYAYDDRASTFTCDADVYTIGFLI